MSKVKAKAYYGISLIQALKRYQKRYLDSGRKPNLTKFLPEVLYRTMRLEGENITRREAAAVFK